MSAIAGFWGFDTGVDRLALCRAMLEAQARSGPAASDLRESGDLALGRTPYRLLPEDGLDAQPLLHDEGRHLLVADLRLDNRHEIAAALGLPAGETNGLSDSDLLLRALLRWGERTPERLLGDFAFAFFDRDARSLMLARDPLGQRPLFFHRGRDFVAFASMPAGIHAAGLAREPDLRSVARYLALLHPAGSASWFVGVERVEPGHVVTLAPGRASSRRYWTPERKELRLARFEDYVQAFRAELDAAVARRLRGTGDTIAAHLSGGWDSGAVAATAARLLAPRETRLIAFTSVPSGDASAPVRRFGDEGPAAARTAALHPNIEHVLVQSHGGSPLDTLDRDFALFQRPLFNPCNHVWLAQIRAAARERGACVLLTGEIGNWTISAAPTAVLADLLRSGRLLAWLREAAAMARRGQARLRGIAASSFGPWIPDPLWRRLSGLSSAPPMPLQSALRQEWWDELSEEQRALSLGLSHPPKDSFAAARAAFMEMDFGEYRKGILAGWGIDKRDATADRRLIEFCLSLPLDALLKDGERRPLARAALADRLPRAVLDERRKGYQASDWHEGLTRSRNEAAALVDAIAADPAASSVVDAELLRALIRDWPAGGWESPEIVARYRVALLQGLAAGHFILAAGRRSG